MDNNSYQIILPDVQKLIHGMTFSGVECCSFFKRCNSRHYSIIPKKHLNIKTELFFDWVKKLQDLGHPVSDPIENEWIVNRRHFSLGVLDKSHPGFVDEEEIKRLQERINNGEKIGVIGDYLSYNQGMGGLSPETRGVLVSIDKRDQQNRAIVVFEGSSSYGKNTQLHYLLDENTGEYLVSTIPKFHEFWYDKYKKEILNAYLICVRGQEQHEYDRLLTHTLLRYTWSSSYKNMLPTFYEILAELPRINFYHALALAQIKYDYNGYFGVFPNIGSSNNPNARLLYFINPKAVQPGVIKGGINSFFGSNLGITPYDLKEVRGLLKNKNYEKAYSIVYKASFRLMKLETIKELEAKMNFGELTKGKKYAAYAENEKSYKVLANDFCRRWYKKVRFNESK